MKNDRESSYFLHDVKNSIAVIEAYVESLKDGIYPYGTMEATIEVVLMQTKALEKQIKEYLLQEKSVSMTYEQVGLVDLESLIYEIVRPYQLKYKHIHFVFEMDHVEWQTNENAMRTIVSNILINAIRYAKTKVHIELNATKLSITNDGPKIEEDILSKITELYVVGKRGQTGLGIPHSMRLIKALGLNLDIINEENNVSFVVSMK